MGIIFEIQVDRSELSELLAGVFPHINYMRDAQLLELLNVPVQPDFTPKGKPLGHEENDHAPS